jgi:hypothetical protein
MKDAGVETPWVLGTADKFVIIHSIVSWVWGKGGDFISPDGKRAIFLEQIALDGLEAYFRLMQYTPNAGEPLSVATAKRLFVEIGSCYVGTLWVMKGFSLCGSEFRDRLGGFAAGPLIAG